MTALRYLEDIEVGSTFELGDYEMAADEVEDFRRRWDPGTMHADGAAGPAASSAHDQPIACGVHSIAVQQLLAYRGALDDWAIVAGRRLREVAFRAPVRAGMVLSGELVVDEIAARSASTGVVVFTVFLRHGDQVVLRVTHETIMLWRLPRGGE